MTATQTLHGERETLMIEVQLRLLRMAIEADDPKVQLLIRVNDLIDAVAAIIERCAHAEHVAKHPYPSRYARGVHWSIDEAWDILDRLPVGMLPDDYRFLLSGRIAGTLQRRTESLRAALKQIIQCAADDDKDSGWWSVEAIEALDNARSIIAKAEGKP